MTAQTIDSDLRSVADVARVLNVAPRVISDGFYNRVLSPGLCRMIGGRRLIDAANIPTIEAALRDAGKLDQPVGA